MCLPRDIGVKEPQMNKVGVSRVKTETQPAKEAAQYFWLHDHFLKSMNGLEFPQLC